MPSAQSSPGLSLLAFDAHVSARPVQIELTTLSAAATEAAAAAADADPPP
jgi:hypothetical protein